VIEGTTTSGSDAPIPELKGMTEEQIVDAIEAFSVQATLQLAGVSASYLLA
jgi:hypothetical protein